MKAYTDIEQSKKLAEKLPIESADHHYVRKTCDFMGNPVDGKWSIPKYGNPQSSHANYLVQNFTSYEIIPCWSLAALLDILPSGTELLKFEHSYHCQSDMCDTWALNPIDACVEMIEKLHKQMIYDFNNG